ncbi:hypothetical protein PBI_NABY_24 [Microbacterium phage Naby]|nr:hypothetical protein PBI_NABY_24 [Microbacterium phage Naby]
MSETTTTETLNRLTELVAETREIAARCRRARQLDLLNHAREIGSQLDAARNQLITIGLDALQPAAAFAAAGTIQLGGIVAQLDRIDLGVDRIAAERVDAADVIAWLEWHGVHLYPYQRRAIERHLAA